MNNDTIFALSSGLGKSGVAVIRISGNSLSKLFSSIIHKDSFESRHAYFTNLTDNDGILIDQCIAILFQAPNSFTGEDIIEIHSHGSPAVINKIYEFLQSNNCRIADRGEFSKRAFYNNKMDLTDVDGLIALLNAQTDKQRASALRSLIGHDSNVYKEWRNQMIEISAYSAAILDYSEDDLPKNITEKIIDKTKILLNEISSATKNFKKSQTLQNGFNIVLTGETNVGKSSIFNTIVGSNRAIVSDIAGTTRDVISAQIDIDGYLVNLLDTAGIRDTSDIIENLGIEQTKKEIENADLIIHVYTEVPSIIPTNEIVVINKSDLLTGSKQKGIVYTSAKTGDGISELLDIIKQQIKESIGNTEGFITINTRTHKLLLDTISELTNAIENSNDNYDIYSEHIRHAADYIGKILGIITTNEIADATFSQLCLGK